MALLGGLAPRLTDKLMETMFAMQTSDRPEDDRTDNSLYAPTTGLKERGGRSAYVAESSLYTQASLHPILTGAALAATGLTLASWLYRRPWGEQQERATHRWYQADKVKH
jgi:hypothetical protein